MAISFLPFKKLAIVTPKSQTDVIILLRNNIDDENKSSFMDRFTTSDVPFYGYMEHNLFSLRRKKGFLGGNINVVLEGEVVESGDKTLLRIRSQFDFLGKAMFAGLGISMLAVLLVTPSIAAICSIAFWYIFMMSYFSYETWLAKSDLFEVLKANVLKSSEI